MEKQKIMEIVAEGKALSEKRTWVSKGYQDLLTALNKELANIPDMPEDDIEFTLKKWEIYSSRQGANLSRQLTVDLKFSGDAYIVMMIGKQTNSYSDGLDWDDIKDPSVANIRLFASKIQEMLDYFLAQIRRRNNDNQAAIDIMTGIIDKLTR